MEPALKIFGWGSLVLSLLQALLTIAAAATGTPLSGPHHTLLTGTVGIIAIHLAGAKR